MLSEITEYILGAVIVVVGMMLVSLSTLLLFAAFLATKQGEFGNAGGFSIVAIFMLCLVGLAIKGISEEGKGI